jgi:hypothetical protein
MSKIVAKGDLTHSQVKKWYKKEQVAIGRRHHCGYPFVFF